MLQSECRKFRRTFLHTLDLVHILYHPSASPRRQQFKPPYLRLMSRAERARSNASSHTSAPANPASVPVPPPPPKSPLLRAATSHSSVAALPSQPFPDPAAPDMNAAPESLDPIKPRDWSFVEEEQARRQASGASKRRKDPLQKTDVTTGGRLPSIDHSALYSGGNLCMMLTMKDKVQAQRVLDALRELHARKGRRGNTGDLMEKHHLTSHIYFGNLHTDVLRVYCARYRLATPLHSSHERLADAVARHFNAVEPPLETDVLTNLIHHKPPASV